MLNVFREKFKHLKWVLWVVIASFVLGFVYGIGSLVRNAPDKDIVPWAARVDGQVISIQSFQTEARNLESTYRQLLGAQFDQQRAFLRLGQTAITRLVDENLLAREAAKAGLDVSEQEVVDAIMKDPSLQQNGVFIGRDRYEKLYRSNPTLFENYEESVKRQVLLNKLRSLLEDSVTVSEVEVKEAFQRQNEKATFQYLLLDTSKLPSANPSDGQLEAYYRKHPADYPSGEGRSGRYVLFNTREIAASVDVPESEIRSQYLQDQKTLYSIPEKRRASHILVKVSADAPPDRVRAAEARIRKALDRVHAGEDFAKVAKEVSEDSTASSGGDLGFFVRDQMVREFSDATWSLKVGQISEPVRSSFGFHLIRLADVQPAREESLEEARPKILASLKEARARNEAQRRASDFTEGVKSSGGDFQQAARDAGVVPKEFRDVHAGESVADLGLEPSLTPVLFALKPQEVSAPLSVTAGLVVLQYLQASPSGSLPLAKVHDRVRSDLLQELRVEGARKMLEAAGGVSDLAAAAKKLKVELKSTGPVGRSGPAADLGSDGALLSKIFALKVGEVSPPLALPSGSAAVVKMVERPDPLQGFDAQKETLRDSLLRSKKDELFRAYLDRLRATHPAEINTALVAQVDRT